MKKSLLLFFLILGSSFFLNISGQQLIENNQTLKKTRTVFVFVHQLNSQSDAELISKYLLEFKGKIESAEISLSTQMITIEASNTKDIDIIEAIAQKNFTSFIKNELPPPGFKYVYNPDGTWKLKRIEQ